VVELTLGSRQARINGVLTALDAPADTVAGFTMVPLRFVSESLGAEVRWNNATRIVALSSGPGGAQNPATRPSLTQVIHNGGPGMKSGDGLDVVLVGDPGCEASWEILGALKAQPL